MAGFRMFESLRTRNYRLFFTGELVSHTGGWMSNMAEAWLVFQLTDSGAAVGATFAFRFAPVFFFGLWGGSVVDRLDRRRTLVVTQLAHASVAALLFALVATDSVETWMVFAVAFVTGLVTVIDQPAHHAFVEEMVGPDRIANAVALNSAVLNAARITGPALAGLIIAAADTSWVFLCNAASFLVVVVALLAMDRRELRPLRRQRQPTGVRDGLRHTWSVKEMRSTIALVAVVGTLVYNFPTFLTIMAKDTFGGNADAAGALMAVLGVGTIFGALTAAHRGRQTRTTVIKAGAALAAALLLTALMPMKPLLVASLVPLGAVAIFFGATSSAHMQASSAQEFRGRTMAVYSMLTLGATLVGGPLMGEVSDRWGARAGLGVAGAATGLMAAVLALLARRGEGVDVDELAAAESAELAVETAT
jgi:predicted MFS family arabinose efflux permease